MLIQELDLEGLEGAYVVIECAGEDREYFVGSYRTLHEAQRMLCKLPDGGDIMKVRNGHLTTEF